jgi:hypothetical protein
LTNISSEDSGGCSDDESYQVWNERVHVGQSLQLEPSARRRHKTTMSQSWIAKHLSMKNAANVSRVIHRMDLSRIEKKVPETFWCFVSEKLKENEP